MISNTDPPVLLWRWARIIALDLVTRLLGALVSKINLFDNTWVDLSDVFKGCLKQLGPPWLLCLDDDRIFAVGTYCFPLSFLMLILCNIIAVHTWWEDQGSVLQLRSSVREFGWEIGMEILYSESEVYMWSSWTYWKYVCMASIVNRICLSGKF